MYSNKEISKIKYISSEGKNVEKFFYIAIDDGVYLGKINNTDKEILVWKTFNEVENSLSYQNLKSFWNTIKSKIEEVIEKKVINRQDS